MSIKLLGILAFSLAAVLANISPVFAADPVVLTLKNHVFAPDEVTVSAGERLRINVKNLDTTPAEFESHDLRVEKFVAPGGQISVTVGPLKPGIYKFFDDYHPQTALGTLIAVNKVSSE